MGYSRVLTIACGGSVKKDRGRLRACSGTFPEPGIAASPAGPRVSPPAPPAPAPQACRRRLGKAGSGHHAREAAASLDPLLQVFEAAQLPLQCARLVQGQLDVREAEPMRLSRSRGASRSPRPRCPPAARPPASGSQRLRNSSLVRGSEGAPQPAQGAPKPKETHAGVPRCAARTALARRPSGRGAPCRRFPPATQVCPGPWREASAAASPLAGRAH